MPIMPQEWLDKSQENQFRWFKGNLQAVELSGQIFNCVELWDDLIDKDVEITPERINACFAAMFAGFISNDWFVNNRQYYFPLIVMCINGFLDSNKMSNDSETKIKHLAFHIRNLGIEIIIATTFLIGGFDYMNQVSEEIRRFYAFESFKEWEYA